MQLNRYKTGVINEAIKPTDHTGRNPRKNKDFLMRKITHIKAGTQAITAADFYEHIFRDPEVLRLFFSGQLAVTLKNDQIVFKAVFPNEKSSNCGEDAQWMH